MGFYSFYKVFSIFKFFWYGLTSRRNRKLLKMLLICIGIAMLIFWLSINVEVQASTMNDDNVTDSIRFKYDSICIDFIRRFERLNETNQNNLRQRILENTSMNYYIYYGSTVSGIDMLDSGTYSDYFLNIAFYTPENGWYTFTYSNYTYYMGLTSNHILKMTRVDPSQGITYCRRLYPNGNYNESNVINELYIPSELLNYNSWVIYDYFYNGRSLETIQQTLEEMQTTQNEINDKLSEITNEEVDEDSMVLPEDTTTDITESGIDSIYSNIVSYIQLNPPGLQYTTFTIPFLNKSFDVVHGRLRVILRNSGWGAVVTIIESIWWFGISRYIILDVYHIIENIKKGNIAHTDSNIKADAI